MNQQVGFQDSNSVCQQQGDGNAAPEFSQRQMEQFLALPYKRPEAVLLLSERADLNDRLQAHLLRISFESTVPFNEIMVEFNWQPLWVEFKHKSYDRWAFVLPDLYQEGRFRVQFFDLDGMIRHRGEKSLSEAVEAMVMEGYIVKAQGKLDELSPTNRWKRGTEIAGLIQKLNSKQITTEQFYELQQKVIDEYPC